MSNLCGNICPVQHLNNTIMSNIQTFSVKFSNKKNNNCARFSAYIGKENSSFTQSGDFRSDFAFKMYDDLKSLKNAIVKYLKNPNARIERVSVDGQVVVFDEQNMWSTSVTKSVLNAIG